MRTKYTCRKNTKKTHISKIHNLFISHYTTNNSCDAKVLVKYNFWLPRPPPDTPTSTNLPLSFVHASSLA